jgi:hypothetical protein
VAFSPQVEVSGRTGSPWRTSAFGLEQEAEAVLIARSCLSTLAEHLGKGDRREEHHSQNIQ